jgi:pimeloyl-ACP methyl ester carboxylesterase
MRRRVATALLALAVLAGAAAPAAAKKSSKPAFRSMPCPEAVEAAGIPVDCGSVAVFENRADPGGRTIRVAAAILQSPARHPKRDPIVFLDGGPSFGAISDFAPLFYFAGAPFFEDRDVILVDTRGTGISTPRLGCPEFDEASVAASYSQPFVDSEYSDIYADAVEACRDRLTSSGIDLSAYNSAESAADLDDLRRALGHQQWNLLAISADGVLGLTYMRLYPKRIRSAILDSPISPQYLEELDYWRGTTDNLERVFAGCAANAACNATYPDIRDVFFDFVHDLQANPAIFTLADFEPQPVTFRLTGADFYRGEAPFVFPDTIHLVLDEIWRSAHGDVAGVLRDALGTGPFTSDLDSAFAQGKTTSYLCHDVIGFETQADRQQAALDLPELAPFFFSRDYGLPIGPEGCQIWGAGVADAAQHQPVSSRIPTLVLTGEFDSAVPRFISHQIPPTLPNSFLYDFPASGHLQLTDFNPVSPCARSIAEQFLRRPKRSPDASCVEELPPFDFTPPSGDAALRGSRVGAWTQPRPAPSPRRASHLRSCGSPRAITAFPSRRCGTR